MNLTDRLAQLIEHEEMSVRAFETLIGASNGLVRKAISSGSDIQSRWITAIAEKFPQLSMRWLLLGEGCMLIDGENQEKSSEIQIIHKPKTTEANKEDQRVYLYDLEATAGLKSLLEHPDEHIIDVIRIPNMPSCDGAVHVVGDSMYPILKSGDIILYKEVSDLSAIFWGEMYLLSMAVDDEEYITVKYIQRSSEGTNHIKLVSHNPHHDPKDIPLASVRAIALVKASIRLHTII